MNTYRAELRATLAPPRGPVAIFTAWAVLMGSAQATQPPDVVTSDGMYNTAGGEYALYLNNGGSENTAFGYQALADNENGYDNTAFGVNALVGNQTGEWNTASGVGALESNLSGGSNSAFGYNAAFSSERNSGNSAFGYHALLAATGDYNIAIGSSAGLNVASGSYNILIGSGGLSSDGLSSPGIPNGVIRIGTPNEQYQTYIAGISNSQVTGAAVYVTSSGQLGVLASSERYKTAIQPMGENTRKLEQLRPVSFHLKTDPRGAVQYGLIAEEVDKVYPELVIRDDKGKIQGVRYDELAPMLLNERQQQRAQLDELRGLKEKVAHLEELLTTLQAKTQQVAMR